MTKETKTAKYLMSTHNLQMQREKRQAHPGSKNHSGSAYFSKVYPQKKKPASFFNHVDSVFKVVLPTLQGLKQAITS